MISTIELAGGWWIGVLSHLWQTAIVIGVLAALAFAMRRAPARLLNALWWIGLAKLLIPFQLVAPAVRRAFGPIAARVGGAGIHLDGLTVWLDRAAPVLDPAGSAARAHPGALDGAGAAGVALVATILLALLVPGKPPRRGIADTPVSQ